MKWFFKALIENYATFSGRARRKEYWMFVLFQIIILFTLSFISSFLEELMDIEIVNLFIGIYVLATLIPWLSVNSRRLHDIGKSGTYFFINLIPIIGRIWYIILVASNGDNGPNKYGLDPKRLYEDDEIDAIGKPLLEE